VKKRTVQIVLTVILSIAALYIALRGINFADVRRALSQVRWVWIALTFGLILVTLVIRAERWRILLGRTLSLSDTFGLINIGYLISGVLPLRAGDPARAVGASLRGDVPALAALSTVVVERVLDLLMVILILVGTLPFVPGLRDYLAAGEVGGFFSYRVILILSGILAFGILLALVLIAVFPAVTEALGRWLLAKVGVKNPDRWLAPLHHILEGLDALRSFQDGGLVLFWSIMLWVTTAVYFITGLQASRAFIPEPTALKGVVAMWASAFGMVFPATGGIGSFHFAVREALFWGFDLPRDLGFAYAVLIHALPYLTGIALGALALITWGLSVKRLIGTQPQAETYPSEQHPSET
jgi:hypothetical protein